MDSYEATKVVMSRIQCLDPDNASKIMGYILIQDQGEKEVIRLAFSPESLLLSYINQAKACLGLSSSTTNQLRPPPPPPGSPLPPRLMIPNGNGNGNSPSSPSPGFQSAPRPFSYAAALNGSPSAGGDAGNGSVSPSFQFYGGADRQIQDQLPFVEESAPDPVMSPSGRSDSMFFHYGDEDLTGGSISSSPVSYPFHRRSCSVNDAAFLSNLEDGGGSVGGFGWRPPCMYFAKGHCKNGSSCKFIHGDAIEIDELLRMKALEQQRIASLMGMGHHHHHHHHHPFGYTKCMDFLNENPRPNAAAADELRKYGFNSRAADRNEFSPVGLFGGGANSSSRQIYLTFPADSTFKEEDVSNYFSTFGPVQDVRIPYQQKRMFGFVTFHFPETVNLILAKGNPHFVCDSRVLVKPYKEKGKIQEKKQQQQQQLHEQSPTGDHIDLPFGPRVLLSSQEMILRRKLEEEAELQHAIELQSRRMMNLQLMDLKNLQQQQQQQQRNHQLLMNPNFANASSTPDFAVSPRAVKSSSIADQNAEFPESLEHVLPDNLFAASPTKVEASDDNNNKQHTSPNTMAAPKFKCQAIDI